MLTKTAMTRYSSCMRSFQFTVIAILLFSPIAAMAEQDALPPPNVDESTTSSVDDSADVGESAPNLGKELKSPPDSGNVDIRSYQRKDGAIVTEYSLHGQVYELKVQPAGGLPAYYLYPDKSGHMERRRPGGEPFVTPPSWILKKF